MNYKLAIFICMLGLASLASAVAGAKGPRGPPRPAPLVRSQAEAKGRLGLTLYSGDSDSDDDDYESDEEKKLAELVDKEYDAKEDCKGLYQRLTNAKKSNKSVEPEVQKSYDESMQVLRKIQTEIKALVQKMSGNRKHVGW